MKLAFGDLEHPLCVTRKGLGRSLVVQPTMWRVDPKCAPPSASILVRAGQDLEQLSNLWTESPMHVELEVRVPEGTLGRIPYS
ncbi:hypothetical protein B0G84_7829 [Paraburkholderia sp. BL8N3]|nr:hypothetical protein [Paraburkholderia sp. BL8N3]TCK33560.1 hypothetical protein B0G84_7829 [Paraburkholderia sp. BL8N3]